MSNRDKIVSLCDPLSKLNSWARLPSTDQLDMSSIVSHIYKWKRSLISAAIQEKLAQLRIVAVERECKTCKGTGTYIWHDWNDEDNVEYQSCRRCNSTGRVVLRFVESRIADDWTCHTPRPKWDLGIFADDAWDKLSESTNWEPEQPGHPMERLEFIHLLNRVEDIILEGRPPESRIGNASDYTLHLGHNPDCWICGSINVRYDWDIYRSIGLRWKCGICDNCDRKAAWGNIAPTWPVNLHRLNERDNFPQWIDRVPLPKIASDPAVIEWLMRRQVYPGAYPPGDYAYTPSGQLVRVVSSDPNGYEVEVIDRHGYTGNWDGRPCREYIGWLDGAKLRLDTLVPTGRLDYVPDFDWSEVRP